MLVSQCPDQFFISKIWKIWRHSITSHPGPAVAVRCFRLNNGKCQILKCSARFYVFLLLKSVITITLPPFLHGGTIPYCAKHRLCYVALTHYGACVCVCYRLWANSLTERKKQSQRVGLKSKWSLTEFRSGIIAKWTQRVGTIDFFAQRDRFKWKWSQCVETS